MADQPQIAGPDAVEAEVERDQGGRIYSVGVLLILTLAGVAIALNGVLLGIGSVERPGPGLWPVVIGTIWALAGLTATAAALFKDLRLNRLDQLAKPGIGAGLGILFVVLFSYVGFVVAMVFTLALWLRILGSFTWKRTALVTAVVTALLYLLFAVIVGTTFPATLLG